MDAYEQLEEDLREAVERCIGDLGGYHDSTKGEFVHGGGYNEVKKTFERVMKEEIQRFSTSKKPQSMWPFNDKRLHATKRLKEFFPILMRYIIQRSDQKGQEEIQVAGGKSAQRNPDEINKFGNCVVRANVTQLMKDAGKSERTVFRYLKEFVSAGVLVALKTNSNGQGLYVIGDWQMTNTGGFKPNPRLNRRELKDEIRAGLIAEGLVSEVKK